MAPFPEIGTNCISRSEVGWPVSRREPIDIRRGFPPKWPAPFGAEPGGRAPFGAAGRHLARPGAIWRGRAPFGASREVVTSRRVPVEGGKLT